jgi:hypothetical protein
MEARDRLGVGFLYIIHSRRARSFLQPRPQSCQLLARPHGQDFDVAIGIVPDPPRNVEEMRLTLDKPAEPDSLDASAHQKTTSPSRGFLSGSHRSIEELRGQIAEGRNNPKGFTSAV